MFGLDGWIVHLSDWTTLLFVLGLAVLLAAISLHRVAFGMLLVVAFSIGLAVAITAVGLVAVLAKSALARFDGRGRLVNVLPVLSAVVIVLAGAAMVARAFPKVSM